MQCYYNRFQRTPHFGRSIRGGEKMSSVWAQRREELWSDCLVSPDVFNEMVERLGEFVMPYQQALETEANPHSMHLYLQGLLSQLPRKNAEEIAAWVDVERQVLQDFIGTAPWDHRPLIGVLVGQVALRLGESEGIIAFDPSSFPKRGTHSVGVKRQWCGHRGKVDNCQVGVFMGYVSGQDHVLLDFRLSLPKDWARDEQRRQACHVPPEVRYQTRQEQCLEAPVPAYQGRGRPRKAPWQSVTQWRQCLDAEAWTSLTVRDGEKGPVAIEMVKRRVQTRLERKRTGPEEWLGVTRRPLSDDRVLETRASGDATDHDAHYRYHYYLTPTDGGEVAFTEPSLGELGRVIKAGACIEASFKRGKGEVGMDEYQVRTWAGWHHHMALTLLAVWFLLGETHRGHQWTPALTLPQVRSGLSLLLLEVYYTPGVDSICRQVQRQLLRNELARFYHHRTRKCLPPRKLRREIQ